MPGHEDNTEEPTFIEWFKANYPEAWERAQRELKEQFGIDLNKPRRRRRNRGETDIP